MSFLVHSLLVVLYGAAALAIAKLLPMFLPEAGRDFAGDTLPLIYGALALAFFALLHGVYAGLRWRAAAERELADLGESYGAVMGELGAARAEIQAVHDALEASRQGDDEGAGAVGEVVNEVKVLQGLIERLYAGRGPTAAPADKPATGPRQSAGSGLVEAEPPVLVGLDEDDVLEVVRAGLREDRIDLFLQPVVSLPQRRHRYYECFSRIRDDNGAMVLPEQYIAVAEREGLIGAIDNMLLFRCVQLVRKAQRNKRNVGFFCNISAQTLADTTFFGEFISFLAENPDLAPNLHFEFAQADIASLTRQMADHLRQLGELGYRFSLDQVRRLDLNFDAVSGRFFRFIKVDEATLKSYIDERGAGAFDKLKDTLNRNAIDLIVEKVEDEASLVELLDYDIDFAQGFLFGAPRLSRAA